MAAIVEIDEQNGDSGSPTLTHGIANTNMGSADEADMTASEYPIEPGNNSFEKWQKIHVTDMGGSSAINNLKVWRTGSLGGSAIHLTNARESSYGGAETYATPIATASSIADQTMPTTTPTGANLGIGGALGGELTAAGSSDFLIHQIQTDSEDIAGSSSTMNYQYDEVA